MYAGGKTRGVAKVLSLAPDTAATPNSRIITLWMELLHQFQTFGLPDNACMKYKPLDQTHNIIFREYKIGHFLKY